jgi:hypothetical protein
VLRPIYQIFKLDLSQPSGAERVTGLFNYLRMIDATDAAGAYSPDVLVNVTLGKAAGDAIPLRINGLIEAETDEYNLTWTPGSGYATFLIAHDGSDRPGVHVEALPAKQLVTQAAGLSVSTAQGSVGVAAGILVPASGTRQSVTLRNRGAATVFLGGPTVTLLNGFALDPGEAFTFSGTTAAIYAISATAGIAVHWIQEG